MDRTDALPRDLNHAGLAPLVLQHIFFTREEGLFEVTVFEVLIAFEILMSVVL